MQSKSPPSVSPIGDAFPKQLPRARSHVARAARLLPLALPFGCATEAALARGDLPDGAELFVLDGEIEDDQSRYPRHTWLSLPPGSAYAPRTAAGCLLYVSQARSGRVAHAPPTH
jgi:hypothetical protein